MREDVTFNTRDGARLGGWFYASPRADGGAPCIVMSHGITAQIDFGLAPFAELLQASGLAVLVYDHRGWGRSGGEPRNETNPFRQMQDARDAITYATTLPGVDERRIGLWGTSFSGGIALMVAAVDRRIKSVVSVCPFISGSASLRRMMGDQGFADHLETVAKTRKLEMAQGQVQYRQHTTLPESLEWFSEVDRDGQWHNRISVLTFDLMMEFEPGDYVHRISPTPLLMVVPTHDTRSPTDLQLEAYQRAREPKRIEFVEGGHYDALRQVERVGGVSREWFLRTLDQGKRT